MLRKLLEDASLDQKEFLTLLILVVNALLWFFMTPLILTDVLSYLSITLEQNLLIWTAYYLGNIGSMIIGLFASSRFGRLKLLYFWVLLGAVSSLLPAFFSSFTPTNVLIISIIFGVSLGLGIPSCFAYFADFTNIASRGRISGITLLLTSLIAPIFVLTFGVFNITEKSIIFAMWRGLGILVVFLKPRDKVTSETVNTPSIMSIFKEKSFVLYFIAWLMYFFIDRLENPVLDNFFGGFSYLVLAPIVGSFFALFAGILSDRIGRKRVVLYGFVTLGVAYAIIGLFPTVVFSWYFFLTVEAMATGILYVAFILILWGDLSQFGSREKYYAIGATPLFLTSIVQLFATPYVIMVPTTGAFSLASFFLFLSVLPLLSAPETLPKRIIELRNLKKYVETAEKIQRKHAENAVIS